MFNVMVLNPEILLSRGHLAKSLEIFLVVTIGCLEEARG